VQEAMRTSVPQDIQDNHLQFITSFNNSYLESARRGNQLDQVQYQMFAG
jgi:hypothetical protein